MEKHQPGETNWTKTTMLPCDPLLTERKLRVFGEGEFVLRVEVSGEVGENGSALHDAQPTIVMIHQHRNTAIGAFLCEPRLFLNVLADVDALEDVVGLAVCFFQLLEDDGGFVACLALSETMLLPSVAVGKTQTIGRAESQQLKAAVGDQAIGARHFAWDSCWRDGFLPGDGVRDDFDEMAGGLLETEEGSAEHEGEEEQ